MKPRVVVLTSAYPPAFKGGGPSRSTAGLTASLNDEFEFRVVTSATDGGELLPNVNVDEWVNQKDAWVWYSSPGGTVPSGLRAALDLNPDVLYLNSLLSLRFSIGPLLLAWARRWPVPVLLAPRGELSPGALAIRPVKKRLFLAAFRLLRLHMRVVWHATSELERKDIERAFGDVRILFAGNLRRPETAASSAAQRVRGDDPTRIVFFSRIAPKKNLDGLLAALSLVEAPLHLTIAGPVEDLDYWKRCQGLIDRLHGAHQVEVVGPVHPDGVVEFLRSFDLFVLPTFGENFGHAILESLLAGTPVLIGQDTPWASVVDEGAGWLIDPTALQAIADRLDEFGALTDAERSAMAEAAQRLGLAVHGDATRVAANRAMLRSLTDRVR